MNSWFAQLLEAIDQAPDVEGKARVRAIVAKLAEFIQAENS